MIDLGTQKSSFKGEVKQQRKILLGFELINELMEDGRPFVVASRYTLSGFKNAILRKSLENWRAKAYTDEEFETFDITRLLKVPAMLTLTEDGDYTNITAIGPVPKGTALKELLNEPLKLILTNEDWDQAVYDKLSDNLKKTISESPEYQAIKSGKTVQKLSEIDGDELPF